MERLQILQRLIIRIPGNHCGGTFVAYSFKTAPVCLRRLCLAGPSEAIESISDAAGKTGPIMPAAHAEIGLHVAMSNTPEAVIEIVGEVTSHTVPPESSMSPQREINIMTKETSENTPHCKGYLMVDAMSPFPPNTNNQPPPGDSRNLYQVGREAPSKGFLHISLSGSLSGQPL